MSNNYSEDPLAEAPLVVRVADAADVVDEEFHASWSALADQCVWATCFQRPQFVATWYETYQPKFTPYLICGWQDERLVGLLPLAISSEDGTPAVAGTYQAEYQSWLASPSDNGTFIAEAMRVFEERFPRAALTFRYLPHGAPAEHLVQAGYGPRLTQVSHQRPLMRIDADALAKSLSKKSNKSRFNRLKRVGNVTLDRLTTPEELESVIDDVIWQYDLRQGAINHSTPFLEDPLKRPFHLALMRQADTLHVTILRVDSAVVSAHIDYLDQKWSYLGVPSHSPFFFQHSPGKLHMLLLGKLLAEEGVECVDLTPGGDPWKERFANDHDEVLEVSVHSSAFERARNRLPIVVRTGVRKIISGMGVDPKKIKSALARVPVLGPRLGNGVRVGNAHAQDTLYRLGPWDSTKLDAVGTRELGATINQPNDLLRWMDNETLAAKHAVLSVALGRLERNHRLVTCVDDSALLGYGWVVQNPAGVGLDNSALAHVDDDGVLIHGIVIQAPQRTDQVRQTLITTMLKNACEQSPDCVIYALVDTSGAEMFRSLEIELAPVSGAPRSETGVESQTTPSNA